MKKFKRIAYLGFWTLLLLIHLGFIVAYFIYPPTKPGAEIVIFGFGGGVVLGSAIVLIAEIFWTDNRDGTGIGI